MSCIARRCLLACLLGLWDLGFGGSLELLNVFAIAPSVNLSLCTLSLFFMFTVSLSGNGRRKREDR